MVIIKGGSGGGREATLSHTASLAGSHEAFRACCSQAGFYLIEELTEDPKIMVNVLSILTTQPPAKGKRTAVVSVGGGAAVLLADQITAEGMELARFAPETRTGQAGRRRSRTSPRRSRWRCRSAPCRSRARTARC